MKPATKNKPNIYFILALVVLLAQFFLQIYLAKHDSQTTDEGVHLASGYTYLMRSDFRFNPEHPILVKMLAAFPLIFLKINTPSDWQYWDHASDFFRDYYKEARDYGEQFLYNLGNNAEQILFWGRIPIASLAFILGFLIYYIVSVKTNAKYGFLATVLYATNPIVNAHSHYVTTDIAAALGFLLTIYTFVNYIKNKNTKNFLCFCFAFAFALLSKYTAIILFPIIVAIIFLYYIYFLQTKKIDFWAFTKKSIFVIVIIWLIVNAVYFFQFSPMPSGSVLQNSISQIQGQKAEIYQAYLDKYQAFYDVSRHLLMPNYYIKGLGMMVFHTQVGQDSFLLGQSSNMGWWYYFPVLFLLKNYIIFIILFILSIVYFYRAKKKDFFVSAILVSFVIYFIFAMLSKANIGVRHILPAIIMVIVFIPLQLFHSGILKKFKFIFWLIIALSILETTLIFPNYISYFNQLCGGSSNGYKIAGDSNLEWGQDLKDIKKYIEENNISEPYIEYFWDGLSSLDYYGIKYKFASDIDVNNPKGYLVIGASAREKKEFQWLKKYTVYDRINYSVFVYKF